MKFVNEELPLVAVHWQNVSASLQELSRRKGREDGGRQR